jgi:ribosomal protein L7/L12
MDLGNAVAIVIAAGGLVMLFIAVRAQGRADSIARLATIERKLDAVMAHLGVIETRPEYPDVVRHLEEGKVIHAVKAYREQTGLGLADAKNAVDEIARQRGLKSR